MKKYKLQQIRERFSLLATSLTLEAAASRIPLQLHMTLLQICTIGKVLNNSENLQLVFKLSNILVFCHFAATFWAETRLQPQNCAISPFSSGKNTSNMNCMIDYMFFSLFAMNIVAYIQSAQSSLGPKPSMCSFAPNRKYVHREQTLHGWKTCFRRQSGIEYTQKTNALDRGKESSRKTKN